MKRSQFTDGQIAVCGRAPHPPADGGGHGGGGRPLWGGDLDPDLMPLAKEVWRPDAARDATAQAA